MTPTRRPLGAGIVTLVVVDAVLVLTLLVLFVQAVRTGVVVLGSAATASTGTSAPSSTAMTAAGSGDTIRFAMPSRNISCEIAPGAATCLISQFSYATPVVPDCSGTVGNEVRLTADGAAWVCRGGGAPGLAPADVAVLDYGTSASAHGFTCDSARTGVTCRHEESGHSFSLARGGATLD
jgi:hypothetical protein